MEWERGWGLALTLETLSQNTRVKKLVGNETGRKGKSTRCYFYTFSLREKQMISFFISFLPTTCKYEAWNTRSHHFIVTLSILTNIFFSFLWFRFIKIILGSLHKMFTFFYFFSKLNRKSYSQQSFIFLLISISTWKLRVFSGFIQRGINRMKCFIPWAKGVYFFDIWMTFPY